MKRLAVFLPALIALVLLVGSPFCLSLGNGGGLACYCCSGAKGECLMSACPNCRNDTDQSGLSWSPDLILSSFALAVFAQPVRDHSGYLLPPSAVYLEVPVKPPISL